MDMKITSRLLIMMFVQYFMQGAWNMTMGLVLSSYGMASIIGNAYALLGVATIISPLFIGMVADRFFASQKVMGILHLINAVVILCVPQFIEAQNSGMTLFLIFICIILTVFSSQLYFILYSFLFTFKHFIMYLMLNTYILSKV